MDELEELKKTLVIIAENYSPHWVEAIKRATTMEQLESINRALDYMRDN